MVQGVFTRPVPKSAGVQMRHLTPALLPRHAARPFVPQERGATERQLQQIAAEVLGKVYFRDDGRRSHCLWVKLSDLEHLEFDL
ncbi:hypothetical protein IPZ58_29860 [Streptomyces roseoverticillatus]|uniref:hypothetical protein n=1 Tax=Streptomyces roseoverticillatus TaxID=66429 RepID=UPI001F45F4B5|nr:hypothetical protein [Streptomyces roseoverticillatus]MCF3105761.1 hypothetical protein [Streptomyces roseoverticillatus]